MLIQRQAPKVSGILRIIIMIHRPIFPIMLVPAFEGIPIQLDTQTGTFRHVHHIVFRFKGTVLDDIADLPAL